MRHVPLLPGEGYSPLAGSALPGRPLLRLLRLVLAVWLVAGLGYLGWRAVSKEPARAPVPASTNVPPPATSNRPVTPVMPDDLPRHLETLSVKLAEAAPAIRQVEEQIGRALPAVRRNYLVSEKRRLEAALAAAETARRDLEQARAEADFVNNKTQKEQQ